MSLPRPLLFFRHFLITILLLSLVFFGTAAYFFNATRQDKDKLKTISPILFTLDILGHQVKALSATTDDERYELAKALYNKDRHGEMYIAAAKDILKPLVANKHPNSMRLYAEILKQETQYSEMREVLAKRLNMNAFKIDAQNSE